MNEYDIMIIDEDPQELAMLRTHLENRGYKNVEACSSALKALELIEDKKYHIIIMELQFSEIDGIDLLRRIRAYDPLAQVVVLTGQSTIEHILTCLECGANDYIPKRLESLEDLFEAVGFSVRKLERWKNAIKELVK